MPQPTQEQVTQLQSIESNLQQFARQKQQFQAQVLEIDSAMKELKDKQKAYKIVGNIMVESTREDLEKDLQNKKETLNLRIKSIEKQEKNLKQKAEKLQKEVLGQIEQEKQAGGGEDKQHNRGSERNSG